jgi:NADPH-dependent 2,4-dienoyl-CoA reductase/sulfur reductase-like enzyme/rhodanese-related sulfurtransferase
LPYDKLVLATGASPVIPSIPGIRSKNIFTLHTIPDAEAIKSLLDGQPAKNAVIVGGGLIGVETAEALVALGCTVTMVEAQAQILGLLDWEIARLVQRHMESKGVVILTDTKALAFECNPNAPDSVTQVQTDKGVLAADMVVLAIGVRPNTALAKMAGLDIGAKTGAISVDLHMQTSDPDIYAAGDCVETLNRLTGQPCFVPLGSTANKQARVAAINICGGHDSFPGIVGSAVCKVFDFCVARTGLTEREARAAGYDVLTASAPGPDKAHYMPGAKLLMLKLVADKKSGKLLGLQGVGPGEAAKRIDVAATALTAGMTIDDVANLDLSYAPPYAQAMDNLITAANVARNKRDGIMSAISAEATHQRIENGEDFILLDVRSPQEYANVRLPKSTHIPLGSLRKRANELPRDKRIVTFCAASLRGFEASLILRAAGFTRVNVLDGGVAMWPYETEK